MVTQRQGSSITSRPHHTALRLLSTVALLGLLLSTLAAPPATAAHTPPTPNSQQVAFFDENP